MLPLIGLAASLLPEIIRLIAGDKTDTVATQVAQAVTSVTGVSDETAARVKLADPAVAARLQTELARIALDAQKAQNEAAAAARRSENEAAAAARQNELEILKQSFADKADARGMVARLAAAGSPVAYGAPIVSFVIAIGFFGILGMVIFKGDAIGAANKEIVYTLIGTMATAFATMISFWLGSSQGSRNKDDAANKLQLTQAAFAPPPPPPAPPPPPVIVAAPPASAPPPPAAPSAPSGPVVSNFPACFKEVLVLEGGFSDDPRDPGGPTNLGVTRAELADVRRVPIADITDATMKALTLDDVEPIYRSRYWNVMSCDGLAHGVDLMVFQFGVNAGDSRSARLLQTILGVRVDGIIGPVTLAAANGQNTAGLINTLADQQLATYKTFADFPTFGRGWTNRVNQARTVARTMLA